MMSKKKLVSKIVNSLRRNGCITQDGVIKETALVRTNECVSKVLRPLIPNGVNGWATPAREEEPATIYAERAATTALRRAGLA